MVNLLKSGVFNSLNPLHFTCKKAKVQRMQLSVCLSEPTNTLRTDLISVFALNCVFKRSSNRTEQVMANGTLSVAESGSSGIPQEDALSHLQHGHMRGDTTGEVSTHDPGVIADRMIEEIPSCKYLGIYTGN